MRRRDGMCQVHLVEKEDVKPLDVNLRRDKATGRPSSVTRHSKPHPETCYKRIGRNFGKDRRSYPEIGLDLQPGGRNMSSDDI